MAVDKVEFAPFSIKPHFVTLGLVMAMSMESDIADFSREVVLHLPIPDLGMQKAATILFGLAIGGLIVGGLSLLGVISTGRKRLGIWLLFFISMFGLQHGVPNNLDVSFPIHVFFLLVLIITMMVPINAYFRAHREQRDREEANLESRQ